VQMFCCDNIRPVPRQKTDATDRPTDGQNSLQETFELVLETSTLR